MQEHQSGWVQEGRWDRARAVFPLSHCHGEQLGEQSCLPGFSTACTCPLLRWDVAVPCLQQGGEVHTLTEKGHEPCCHHQPLCLALGQQCHSRVGSATKRKLSNKEHPPEQHQGPAGNTPYHAQAPC